MHKYFFNKNNYLDNLIHSRYYYNVSAIFLCLFQYYNIVELKILGYMNHHLSKFRLCFYYLAAEKSFYYHRNKQIWLHC